MIRPYRWLGDGLELLDQRRLPHDETWVVCRNARDVAIAIRDMVVRGAPAIGIAAAYGLALEARSLARGGGASGSRGVAAVIQQLERAADELAGARPTAVNLFWAIERMRALWRQAADAEDADDLAERLVALAQQLDAEDLEMNRAIGRHGRELLTGVEAVLTHCNTGALATSGYGTALGVIRARHELQPLHVYACETRPYLQGARLTAWELQREGIPVTLIVDSAAAWLMKAGRVQAVITGADRIAANGDVANKIGTYALAVLARHHGLPFFVAAPRSTIDLSLPDGNGIAIEVRSPDEVTHWAGQAVAPAGAGAWNPAFDVTPAELVTAIVTDAGVARPPFTESLRRLVAAPVGVVDAGGDDASA